MFKVGKFYYYYYYIKVNYLHTTYIMEQGEEEDDMKLAVTDLKKRILINNNIV